jgi:hypothetical protein
MLTDRLRKVLARVGFHDGQVAPPELAEYDSDELAAKAERYFESIPTDQKREKARAMFSTYTEGKSLCASAEAVGISKSTASLYLNEVEVVTGIAFIRGKKRDKVKLPQQIGDVQIQRETGVRRASVRDFHSFRTTWITLALCSGIPFELVQQVTGHATAEIVMQHYFKPQRAQLKQALEKSMPSLLTVGGYTPMDKVIDLLRQMDANNWNELRDNALAIMEGE